MPFGMDVLGGSPPAPTPDAPPVLSEQLGMPAGGVPPLPPAVSNDPAAMPKLAPAAPTPRENFAAKAIQSILGTRVDYKVDPSTGQTVPVAMPKASGSDIFRGILAGALLGAHAGQVAHNENPQGGMLQGIAAGGAAQVGQNTAVDAQRRQRAQEDFKNNIALRKTNQELVLQQAQIAHMHAEDMHANAMIDLMASDHVQKINDSNNVLESQYETKGTIPPIQIAGQDINGKEGNGYDIMKAVNANPRALDAPDGYHRVHTQHVDTAGLKYEVGKGWVDKDGNNVDMATKTTHTFFDIPNNTFNEAVSMTNKEWNKAIGSKIFPDDDSKRTGTYGDLISFKDKATKEAREAAQTHLANTRASYEVALIGKQTKSLQNEIDKGADRDMRADIANLQEQAKILQSTIKGAEYDMTPEGQAQKVKDTNDLRSLNSTLNTMLQAHMKKQGYNVEPGAGGTAPPPLDLVQSSLDFSSKFPVDQQLSMANDPATPLTPTQRADLIARIKARAAQQPPPAGAGLAPRTSGAPAVPSASDQYNERHMPQ